MMRMIGKLFLALTATVCLALPLSAETRLDTIARDGVLRVGTPGNWKPMSYRDPSTNEYVGFDVDLVTMLAKDMGVKVEFVPTDWKSVAIAVGSKYDLSTSASISPQRAMVAGYTHPYFAVADVPVVLEANAERFQDWEDLDQSDVTIAVTLGTVQEKRAALIFPNAKIRKVEEPARDWQEVLSGRADASMTSNTEAVNLTTQHPQLVVVPVSEMKSPTPIAMLTPRGDQEWINFVNHWLLLQMERGSIDQLKEKWGLVD
ncbi:MAG: transporter substrate-binding domain-containing protein [bacterium]|jgi:cyclohexadienyl dehydratase